MNHLRIKVCGMQNAENIHAIAALLPDYLGFIFHAPSPRDISSDTSSLSAIKTSTVVRKTGVFVNKDLGFILSMIKTMGLQAIQLHGEESPAVCQSLKTQKTEVIKSFLLDDSFDFSKTEQYDDCCDYFLFDTKTPMYGGSGKKFHWDLLHQYHGRTPFFISGGISPEDATALKKFRHKQLSGIDINSRFEIRPGLKDLVKVQTFIQTIRHG